MNPHAPPRRRWTRVARALGVGLFAGALSLGAAPRQAHAAPLSEDELDHLRGGQVVSQAFDAEIDGERYIGGVSYAIIAAPPATVMETIDDPAAYRSILPMVLDAELLGERGGERYMYLRNGSSVASASFVCRIRRDGDSTVRFWLEPSFPHDIDDVFGYFRVEPAGEGKTLLVWAAVLDLGMGVLDFLFEPKVRKYALGTPELVRRYVEKGAVHRAPGAVATASPAAGQ